MIRRYKIYRGDNLLGYVGFDDKWPCEPFEPAEHFQQIEELFEKEHEISMLASEADRKSNRAEAEELFCDADRVLEEILAPGVRFEAMENTLASFECIGLSIHDGRVCWR